MTISVFGVPYSPPYNLIRTVLRELGLSYAEVDVKVSTNDARKYKDVVPFGLIPWIDDDGLIVYESRAVCRYLLLIYGKDMAEGRLLPSYNPSTEEEWKVLANFEQAVCVEQHQFNAYIQDILVERLYKSLRGQPPDLAAVERALEKLDAVLDGYEVILSKQRYIAGNKLTLADLLHLPYGHQIDMLEGPGVRVMVGNPKRPNVLRWWTEISARESYKGLGIEAMSGMLTFIEPHYYGTETITASTSAADNHGVIAHHGSNFCGVIQTAGARGATTDASEKRRRSVGFVDEVGGNAETGTISQGAKLRQGRRNI